MSATQGHPRTSATPENGAQPRSESRAGFNFDLPTTANSAPQDEITPAPARATEAHAAKKSPLANQVPPATTANLPPTAPALAQATVGLSEQLNASDSTWKFKAFLRFLLVNLCLVGIGTMAWIVSQNSAFAGFGYFFGFGDDYWFEWPSLVTFSVSVLWCIIYFLVLVGRKRVAHPGIAVALDLILWLAFMVTAAFAVLALVDLQYWGPNNSFGYYYGSDGQYVLAPNGTVVWSPGDNDSSDQDYNSTRTCDGSDGTYYAGSTSFTDCAEVDALINKLWQSKPHRVDVLTAAVVCQFFGIIIHKILFIWACVDTHRYNRRKAGGDAEKIAAGIVQTMINNGAIIPPRGQQSQGAYFQLPGQQAYPLIPVNTQMPPINQKLDNTPALPPRPRSSTQNPQTQETVAGASGAPVVQQEVQEKGKGPQGA